jgi:PAS domain S-box-containing protein
MVQHDLYEKFFALSLDLLCIIDIDGYFRQLSQSWDVLGYPLEDLIGTQLLKYVHPDDIPMTEEALFRLQAYQSIDRLRNRFRCQDGEYRLMEWRCRRHGDWIYAVARDITDLGEIEKALQESEARYRSVVTSMSEGIVVHGKDGAILTCNRAAERILGLTQEQMKGLTSVDPRWHTIHEDGSPFPGETHPAMITLRTGRSVSNVVMGVHKPDGDLTWILVNSEPIISHDDGKSVSAVVASFTDITDLKRMSEALKQSEIRFRTISELITNYAYGFLVLPDDELKYEWVVGAFEGITGYTAQQLNTQGGWLNMIYHDDLPVALERLKRLMNGQETIDEFRVIDASGNIRWIRDYAKPIWDEQENRVVFIYGAAQDITAHKQAQLQQLELATERERINILADFITATSHELRTPLSVINTSLYLLMRLEDQDKRKEKAKQITDQVIYLNRVITQLHEVVRLDRISELELDPISLSTFVPTFVEEYRYKHPEVIIDTIIPANLPIVHGSRLYLQHLLTQWVDNAVRFSPPDTPISIIVGHNETTVTLSVKDEGIGIPQEHLDKIFNPLYKVNSSRTKSENGVGVGLTITKRIMQLHHGFITVHSKLGEGATFTAHFPIPQSIPN